MEPSEYQILFEFETDYWWYRYVQILLLDIIKGLTQNQTITVLDAGCGTGQNIARIEGSIPSIAYGFDISHHAFPWLKKRGLHRLCQASVNSIPYANNTFDIAFSIDVFESEGVDQEAAMAEMWRVTKANGYILILVPAYEWLYTKQHHQAVHAIRRYTKTKLLSLISHQPIALIRITYCFAFVFPIIATYRLLLRLFQNNSIENPRSELSHLPGVINNLLFKFMMIERRLISKINLPFGSSILLVLRKEQVEF